MSKQNLREKKISGDVVFQGRFISMQKDIVRLPNGHESSREFVKHPGAVAIVALHNEEIILVRQYRYAVADELLEIPAGKLDPGEEPLSCAQRELREETGYEAELTPLGAFYTTPGFTNEKIYFYWAKNLVWNPLELDDDEFLEVEKLNWSKAVSMARNGEFRDAKTALGILLVQGRIE